MGIRRWMFFHPNDGTVPYPNNPDCDNYLLWERISDLENYVETLRTRNTDLTQELERYQGRVMYGEYQDIRDEERIDSYVSQQFINRDDFMMHLRRQQATRIVERLLEENLIDHSYMLEDGLSGDHISRMRLRIVPPIIDNSN